MRRLVQALRAAVPAQVTAHGRAAHASWWLAASRMARVAAVPILAHAELQVAISTFRVPNIARLRRISAHFQLAMSLMVRRTAARIPANAELHIVTMAKHAVPHRMNACATITMPTRWRTLPLTGLQSRAAPT